MDHGEEEEEDEDGEEEGRDEDLEENDGDHGGEEGVEEEDRTTPNSGDQQQRRSRKGPENKGRVGKGRKAKDRGYGVARGIDFRNVSFVVNFDFPLTSAAYTHRIGRTARAGNGGSALSFVRRDTSEEDLLAQVQAQQPPLDPAENDNVLAALTHMDPTRGPEGGDGGGGAVGLGEARSRLVAQPSLLEFNMSELDNFRYRVEDTLRSVTSAAVKEFRAAELKHEILNSTKLKSFFAENPTDLKVGCTGVGGDTVPCISCWA